MPAEAAGVIHDLGYRRYDGPRLGRAQIVRALVWHSFRTSFGLGRSVKAKVVPVIVFFAMCLPAAVNAFAVARGNPRLVPYDTYVPVLRAAVMTIFVAVQAPELMSRDLRSHVMPLYFARPLRRTDYPLAKYIAFTAACLVMIEVPLLLLYLGTIASLHSGGAVWDQTKALIPGLLVGLMWALVMAAASLLLASLSGRRAYATGAIAMFFFLTYTLATLLIHIESGGGPAPGSGTAVKVAGLLSPFTLFDSVRRWLGGTTVDQVPAPGSFGIVYLLVLLALFAACLGGLAARYREMS